MTYFLDTDTVSLWQRGNQTVLRRLAEHEPADIRVTVVTIQEQTNGRLQMISRTKTPEQSEQAYRLLAETFRSLRELPIADFTQEAIQRFEHLLSLKLNVGKNDLRIAAIALQANGIVVTRNRRDFERVPGLRIEDWSSDSGE